MNFWSTSLKPNKEVIIAMLANQESDLDCLKFRSRDHLVKQISFNNERNVRYDRYQL